MNEQRVEAKVREILRERRTVQIWRPFHDGTARPTVHRVPRFTPEGVFIRYARAEWKLKSFETVAGTLTIFSVE